MEMDTADVSAAVSVSREFRHSIYELLNGERIHSCIQCGTCSGICPLGPWMEFTPRKMVALLREELFEEVLEAESVWMCVSCCACTNSCPQEVPLTAALMTRTKEELLLSGQAPRELQVALKKTMRYGNPMGESARKRAVWCKGISPPVRILANVKGPVDVLWFVGDYASYHPRLHASTRALAQLLNRLEIDFAILGHEEVSDGDSQRLAGEKGLFGMLAEKNRRVFEKYQFNEIITSDPHAYNAFKHEYPRLGISYPVSHSTEFLAQRLDQLEPLLKHEINALVAYHDPCYLGRANGVYEEPRQLLEAIPGVELVEMSHNRANSLCCGGGGGGMWLDGYQWEKTGTRLSEWRIREALNAWPEVRFDSVLAHLRKRRFRKRNEKFPTDRILAVACPYEAPRFEDAAKMISGASELMVRDICELLLESIESER
jgi:Fe-S oxidoreductase